MGIQVVDQDQCVQTAQEAVVSHVGRVRKVVPGILVKGQDTNTAVDGHPRQVDGVRVRRFDVQRRDAIRGVGSDLEQKSGHFVPAWSDGLTLGVEHAHLYMAVGCRGRCNRPEGA